MVTSERQIDGQRNMVIHWFYTMDNDGETPMSRALKSGHRGIQEVMMRQELADAPDRGAGDTLLQRAAYWGMENAVRKLLATGADPDERDVTGETPLHKAARRGHTNSVQALIESGADVNEMDSLGMSSLHWVAMNGRVDVAEILLSAGADVNSRDYSYTSMTPLGVAKLMGYDEVADLIGAYGGGY
ncbi:MAG: ankyrin repeat domain-containing protein [Candidatus Hydrogenedentes bacterium]|nr:ankyrin repeat domain-containing protein [Candidatus Hydrogenedentota bacterium]